MERLLPTGDFTVASMLPTDYVLNETLYGQDGADYRVCNVNDGGKACTDLIRVAIDHHSCTVGGGDNSWSGSNPFCNRVGGRLQYRPPSIE